MKIVAVMGVIIIHGLFDTNISKESGGGYAALAKCVVVSQQRKQQQNESSGEERNKTIDERITNESMIWTTTTAPCYYCDHDHLRDQYEEQYQIAATLNAEDKEVVENTVNGQRRWRDVVAEAMEMQQAKHYKQSLNLPYKTILEDCDNRSVDIQRRINLGGWSYSAVCLANDILKTDCSTRTCTQTFVVLYNDQPIPAEIVVSDLSLLSLSRISTRLKIPVESITTVLPVAVGKSQWWIVAVVIGVAAGIIAAGWLCLFVYYNSCGRPYTTTTAEKPLIHTILLKDKFIQTAENNNGSKYFDIQPWDTESNKKKSVKTISSQNGSLSRMQEAVEDAAVIDVASEAAAAAAAAAATTTTAAAAVTTSANNSKQSVTRTDIDQQSNYPISIITRPRRREDLHIHKLKSLSDVSAVPTLKEISVEEKLHPHPIPPTVSGILEVKSLTEQMFSKMHRNPMNCL